MGLTEESKKRIGELALKQDDETDLTMGKWLVDKLDGEIGFPIRTAEDFSTVASVHIVDALKEDLSNAARLKIKGYDDMDLGTRNRMKRLWVGHSDAEFWLVKLFRSLYGERYEEFGLARSLLNKYERALRGEPVGFPADGERGFGVGVPPTGSSDEWMAVVEGVVLDNPSTEYVKAFVAIVESAERIEER